MANDEAACHRLFLNLDLDLLAIFLMYIMLSVLSLIPSHNVPYSMYHWNESTIVS